MPLVDRTCKRCKAPFKARQADVNRGWGRFCSKSCKAIKQTEAFNSGKRPKAWKRHDGHSPMKHKTCYACGDPAINGVYVNGGILWGCLVHHDTTHPNSSEGLGQWQ